MFQTKTKMLTVQFIQPDVILHLQRVRWSPRANRGSHPPVQACWLSTEPTVQWEHANQSANLLNFQDNKLTRRTRQARSDTHMQRAGWLLCWRWCRRSSSPGTDRCRRLRLCSDGWCEGSLPRVSSATLVWDGWKSHWVSTCGPKKVGKKI